MGQQIPITTSFDLPDGRTVTIETGKLATQVEVQLAYAIGVAEPVSILVQTFGSAKVAEPKLAEAVREVFDCRPRGLIEDLDLLKPIYRNTAAYGHFGRDEFPWEKTDKVDALKAACK